MAQMPVEIIEVGNVFSESISRAISLANSIQSEIVFSTLSATESQALDILAFNEIKAEEFMDSMDELRISIGGYHPFLVAFVDAELEGKDGYINIFGDNRPEKGLAVFTVSNVPDLIIPVERMVSYFLYYLAKSTLTYIVTEHKNHPDTESCVFDRKIHKPDLLLSMRARAFCDNCRRSLSRSKPLSRNLFRAITNIFDMSGRLLEENLIEPANVELRPRAFIGSSSEGLNLSRSLKELLKDDLSVDIWNEGTIFGLGDSTLEALEHAVLTYEFGIFVFTPDDKIHIRGELKPVARDNVIFEAGLFIGKLTRRRAFVVHPSKNTIALPTDLSGITTALYDPSDPVFDDAMRPASQQIREAVARAKLIMRGQSVQ
jgi:predicted nucleotide-binding protein